MSKSYMTAEEFEIEVELLQKRTDKAIHRINTFATNKIKTLHDALSEDQKDRVRRRFQAKANEQRQRIISRGLARFN